MHHQDQYMNFDMGKILLGTNKFLARRYQPLIHNRLEIHLL